MTTTVSDKMQTTPALDFKNRYVSSNLTISSGLVSAQVHGLAGVPYLTQAHLLCLTTEAGYSPGDNVTLEQSLQTGGCLLAADGTNVTAFLQGLPKVPNKSTGVPATITAANWRLVLRAWFSP